MIRRNNKLISTLLSMAIVSGMVTPVYAAEEIIDSSSEQAFSLENAELEKISDDTDILDESSADINKTENSDDYVITDEVINNVEKESEVVSSEEIPNSEKENEEINNLEDKNENNNVPLYDPIDEEMENYLKEYMLSSDSGISDEELDNALQEYLEKLTSENEELKNLEEGIYTVNNNVIKMDSLDKSILREYLAEESMLEIKDGKISVTLIFDKNVTTLDKYKILVNDKNTKYKILESNESIVRIKFSINNFSDNIVLQANVSNDYYDGNQKCRILLDITSMNKVKEEVAENNDENIEDGTYILSNSTRKFNENKESILGNYLSGESVLEVKNGQKYLTLVFDKDVSVIKDCNIYVNNYISNYKVLESSDEILKIRFQIESLDDEIVIDADIKNEFYDENFKGTVVLDSDSLYQQSDEYYVDESMISNINLEEIMTMNEEVSENEGYDLIVKEDSNNKLSQSRLIVKEGKMRVQLTFIDASELGSVKEVIVNGNQESERLVEENNEKDTIVIEVPINSFNDVINIVFSNSVNNDGWNDTTLKSIEIKDIRLNTGTYDLDITSNGKRYISSTQLEVNDNGKMYLINKFGMGSLITVTDLNVNDKAQSFSTKLTGQGFASTLIVKTEISSFDDVVNIFVDINLTAMGMGIMHHDMEVRDLRLIGVSLQIENTENQEPEDDEDDFSTSSEVLSDGEYVIGTKVFKTGTQEESMAKSYFKEDSDLIVKDGKYNVTLYADDLSIMSNIVVKVNGNIVNTDIKNNTDGTGTISFDIPRLNSSIVMYCHVDGYGHVADYDFSIGLDKNNIRNSEGMKIDPPSEYEEVQLNKNTEYKINNKLKSGGSEINGLASYVDETSIIEVDSSGNIYLTLNFTMTGLMNGRTITLNNNSSVTSYAVVNSADTNGIRFKISSLSDKIYISSQYGSSVNDGFTLSLIQDTLAETGSYSEGNTSSGSTSTTDDASTSDDDIEDGTYVIKNYCYKEKSDTTSDARGYLDTGSVLVVKNGKKYVILKFTHGKMMSNTSIKVEDTKTNYTVVKNSGNKYYIKFKIDSLSDEIMVTSTIDTGVPSIGVIEGVKFRVLLRESTLKEDDDAADFDKEEDIEEEEEEEIAAEEEKDEETVQEGITAAPPSNEIIDNNITIGQSKKLTYKVNNEIVTDSQIGYQAARGAVNNTSLYEIENDKKYITLGFSQTDILNNIRISNNGKSIAYTVVNEDKSKNTMNIRFEVPSISTQLTVTANVTAMGRDISFGLKFLETTLELISTEEFENISNNMGGNGGSSSSGMLSGLSSAVSSLFSGESSAEGGIEVSEEAAEDLASLAKEYFKKYTVNNEVISDSAIGRTMARKYLSETSIIEEIDGQLYAAITFSSASSMGNFRIDVNGETVSHTVPLKDMGSDLISLRFPISSVNDDIRAYIFISPMKMTIDFGIKFLEDTMTLIDEGTIGEEVNNESSSLADTLSELNQTSQSNKNQMSTVKVAASTSVMVIVLNQGIAGLGSLFRRFKNKSLLSKITNIE